MMIHCFDFNLLGLSFLPPKKKMLEVIESDRKRNSKRSDCLEIIKSSHGELNCVWFYFSHSCHKSSSLMVHYIPYMDFMAQQVSSGAFSNDPVCVDE